MCERSPQEAFMILSPDLINATTERFERRAPEREETLRKIETLPPAQVDSSERVRQRVDRLVRASRAPEAMQTGLPRAAVRTPPDWDWNACWGRTI
jgi:hypothetical protein